MIGDPEASRLALMYLKVDPSVKDEFCEKATVGCLDDLLLLEFFYIRPRDKQQTRRQTVESKKFKTMPHRYSSWSY
jgi:hypothetical protein